MSSLLFDILNYQEEVCKWSSVATHAEREELNGLSTVWLMNVALSLSSVVDVLSIISWLRILVIVEYDFRKETSKDSKSVTAF
ncbi:BnaC04g19780D [Brassica napus]|uniref:BnaC04g19780D protein n=1 Tax=Brassica napus TaxID=3708 RepID=A0A078F6I6_BRANA|nr:BnaC04g19780D [Brassica napus]